MSEMGRPFVSRFLPGQIGQLLREHGFGEIADFGPDEARASYFQDARMSTSPEPSGWLPPPSCQLPCPDAGRVPQPA